MRGLLETAGTLAALAAALALLAIVPMLHPHMRLPDGHRADDIRGSQR